jgi:hypothetical protein
MISRGGVRDEARRVRSILRATINDQHPIGGRWKMPPRGVKAGSKRER